MAEKRYLLTNIDWEETSGVDHPANQVEGWMVMKSEEDIVAKVEQELELIEKANDLFRMLVEFMRREDLPNNIKAASKMILDWLVEQGLVDGDDYGYPSPQKQEKDKGANIVELLLERLRAAKRPKKPEYGYPAPAAKARDLLQKAKAEVDRRERAKKVREALEEIGKLLQEVDR